MTSRIGKGLKGDERNMGKGIAANQSEGGKPLTFEDAKKILYSSRGEVADEAVWWKLEQALNEVRDAKSSQAKDPAMKAVKDAVAAVKTSEDEKKSEDKKKEREDKKESRWVGWIPAGAIVAVVVLLVWFGGYMNSLILGMESKNASSMLKDLALGVNVCTASLAVVGIALNGWKLSLSSKKIKEHIDSALFVISLATLIFTCMLIFFNSQL